MACDVLFHSFYNAKVVLFCDLRRTRRFNSLDMCSMGFKADSFDFQCMITMFCFCRKAINTRAVCDLQLFCWDVNICPYDACYCQLLRVAILVRPSGFLTLNYSALQSFDYERTWSVLFQKHTERTKLDMYVCIGKRHIILLILM